MLTKRSNWIEKDFAREKRKNIHRSSIYNKYVVYSFMTPRDEQRACFPLFMCGVFLLFFLLVGAILFFRSRGWLAHGRVRIQSRQTFCDCFFRVSFLSVLLLLLFSVTILHIRYFVSHSIPNSNCNTFDAFWFDGFLSPLASKCRWHS